MDLPAHIKDFLQTNYYIPSEELDLPYDKMKPYVQELISSRCMNMDANGEMVPKSEDEILNEVKKQFQADINSDISPSYARQVENFVKNHDTFVKLIKQAEKLELVPSDFNRVANLLAAKRMSSEEYADTPKNFSNFLKVREEISTELRVKYFTTRYFESLEMRPENAASYQEQTIKDIATISEMVQSRESDKIAQRFKLNKSSEGVSSSNAASLSFAMAELMTFADKVGKQVKDSPFVNKVDSLNKSFQKKYPKSYFAVKLLGNTAAALTLGPAFSAYKATTGINALKKDFAAYKKEHPNEKGRFWTFIRSKENRKKLMEIGQNTLRLIPGMRAAGIALSAVKNSANLKSSIKNLKQHGINKRTVAAVGIAAVGLLTVSTAAACLNDEVADSINECVSNTFGSISSGFENVVDTVSTRFSHGASIDVDNAGSVLDDISVSSNLDLDNVSGGVDISDLSDHTQFSDIHDTNIHTSFDGSDTDLSDHAQFSDIPASDVHTSSTDVGLNDHLSAHGTDSADLQTSSVLDQAQHANPEQVSGSLDNYEYAAFGDKNLLVQNPNGTNSILFGDGTQKISYQISDGKVMISANNFSVRHLTEEDAKIYNDLLRQARENRTSSYPALDAQQAFQKIKIAEAIKAQYAANPTPELEQQFEALSMSHHLGTQRLDLGDISDKPSELRIIEPEITKPVSANYPEYTAEAKVSFNTADETANGTVYHENGAKTSFNTNKKTGILIPKSKRDAMAV